MITRAFTTATVLAALAVSLLAATPAAAAPANDNFADATVIEDFPLRTVVDTAGATNEEFEASLEPGCEANEGVWFRITPATDVTTITVLTAAPSAVALFEGETPETLRRIACMHELDDRLGSSDGNLHTLEAGRTYHIRIGTASDHDRIDEIGFWIDVEHGITGRITDEGGDPVAGATIWARDSSFQHYIAGACSRVDGKFRVSGLPRDTYKLEFEAGACDAGDDAPDSSVPDGYKEYYEDTTNYDAATPIEVKGERDTTGIEVVLGPKESDTDTPAGGSTDGEDTTSTKPTASASPSPSASPSASETQSIDPTAVAARERRSGGGGWIPLTVGVILGAGLAVTFIIRRRAKRAGAPA